MNLNLYKKAQEILENEQHLSHIGWSGVGKFVDYLETFYTMERKTYTMKGFGEVDRTVQEDAGIIIAKAQGHLCQVLMNEKESIKDESTGKSYRVIRIVFDQELFDQEGHHKIIMSEF